MQSNHKCSFILRLWRPEQSKSTSWQATIEIPETGKRVGFANLEQLFAFLMDFTEHNCDPNSIEAQDANAAQCYHRREVKNQINHYQDKGKSP